MKENLLHTFQHARLTWTALTVEILLAVVVYASLHLVGVPKSIDLLASSIFAIILAIFGLVFNYRIYPELLNPSGTHLDSQPLREEFTYADLVSRVAGLERLGHKNYKAGNYKEALRLYTQQLELLRMPNFGSKYLQNKQFLSSVYYNRANTYDELGEYDKAIEDYNYALDLPNPEPWNVLINRALVYETLGQLDKAEQDVLQAHQRAPKPMPNIERSLVRIQDKLLKHPFDEVTTQVPIRPGTHLDSQPLREEFTYADLVSRVAGLERLGHKNYKAGNYKEALRLYTQQLELLRMPNFGSKYLQNKQFLSSVYYNRANTYDELGEYDKAIEDYNYALDLPNPEPWNVLINRALVYETLGQLDKAEQDVLQAHQRAPKPMPNIERSLVRI